jgi:hypothetical protein
MKKTSLAIAAILLASATFAQQQPPPPRPPMDQGPRGGGFQGKGKRGPNKEKIEMFKVEFITKNLALTSEEAPIFWPVYEAHQKAMKEIVENKAQDEIQVQEAMLAARKKFKSELMPILKSEERVNQALKIDREFLHKIRSEMMRRKGFQA